MFEYNVRKCKITDSTVNVTFCSIEEKRRFFKEIQILLDLNGERGKTEYSWFYMEDHLNSDNTICTFYNKPNRKPIFDAVKFNIVKNDNSNIQN